MRSNTQSPIKPTRSRGGRILDTNVELNLMGAEGRDTFNQDAVFQVSPGRAVCSGAGEDPYLLKKTSVYSICPMYWARTSVISGLLLS